MTSLAPASNWTRKSSLPTWLRARSGGEICRKLRRASRGDVTPAAVVPRRVCYPKKLLACLMAVKPACIAK